MTPTHPPTLRELHDRIRAFVLQPENAPWLAATADHSVLFRGTVFGLQRMDDVQAKLDAGARVDVLWMGANPNPRRDDAPRAPFGPVDASPCPAFDHQLAMGFLGHHVPDRLPWDPLRHPQGAWALYRDALHESGVAEHPLMANVIPWGSRDMRALLHPLSNEDPELAARALRFVDALHEGLVAAVRPRLLVLPLSVADSREIRDVAPEFGLLTEAMEAREALHVSTGGRTSMRCYVGRVRRGAALVPTVVLPHPSAWRVASHARDAVVRDLAAIVRRAAGAPDASA